MGKGGKERLVRIGKKTQRAVLRYFLMRKDDLSYLWIGRGGKQMQRSGMQHMIKNLGTNAGLTDVRCSPHTFRHTFATRSLINGAGEFEVQSLLGHTSLTMTRRYVDTLRSENAVNGHKRFSPVDNMKI